ncbi:MAG: hypothetical protein AAF963_03430, partial [Bacteroidota bacterium]
LKTIALLLTAQVEIKSLMIIGIKRKKLYETDSYIDYSGSPLFGSPSEQFGRNLFLSMFGECAMYLEHKYKKWRVNDAEDNAEKVLEKALKIIIDQS